MGQNQFLETLQAIAALMDDAKALREVGSVDSMDREQLARNKLASVINHLAGAAS